MDPARLMWFYNEVLPWGWGAVVAACPGYVVLRWLGRRWKYRDAARLAAEPRCLRCGYIIRPGGSVVCPECGGDVRERGIVAPGALPPLAVWPWYLLAVLTAVPVGWWAGTQIEERQPFGWGYELVRVVHLEGTPRVRMAEARHVIMVDARGTGRYFGKRPEYVQVWWLPPEGGRPDVPVLLVYADPYRYVASGGVGAMRREGPFDRRVIAEFLALCEPALPERRRERVIEEIDEAVRLFASGAFSSEIGTSSGDVPNSSVSFSDISQQVVVYHVPARTRLILRTGFALLLLIPALWLVRNAVRRGRARRRERWGRAAEGLGLVPRV